MNNQDDGDDGHAGIPAGTLDFLRDDGGYRGSGVGTADQPSVVRAIAACLERHGDYPRHPQEIRRTPGRLRVHAGRKGDREGGGRKPPPFFSPNYRKTPEAAGQ